MMHRRFRRITYTYAISRTEPGPWERSSSQCRNYLLAFTFMPTSAFLTRERVHTLSPMLALVTSFYPPRALIRFLSSNKYLSFPSNENANFQQSNTNTNVRMIPRSRVEMNSFTSARNQSLSYEPISWLPIILA